MAAIDYQFCSEGDTLYLAKKLKDSNKISKDKRVIEENEVLGMFGFVLKRFCEKNNTGEIIVSFGGEESFRARLSGAENVQTQESQSVNDMVKPNDL